MTPGHRPGVFDGASPPGRCHNINQELVASGAAFVYWQYIGGCDRQTYSRLESEARLKQLGVWGVPGGITPPWGYRKERRLPSRSIR